MSDLIGEVVVYFLSKIIRLVKSVQVCGEAQQCQTILTLKFRCLGMPGLKRENTARSVKK